METNQILGLILLAASLFSVIILTLQGTRTIERLSRAGNESPQKVQDGEGLQDAE
jgi:Mn2+/Fe2+ NRAMP family transporter